jgi:hypothetical protein
MDGWDVFGDEGTSEEKVVLSDVAQIVKQDVQIMVSKLLKQACTDLRSQSTHSRVIDPLVTEGFQQFCMDKFEETYTRTESASKLLWDLLLGQAWSHVCFREIFVICQVLKAFSGYAIQYKQGFVQSQLVELIQELDRAIILGAPTNIPLSIIALMGNGKFKFLANSSENHILTLLASIRIGTS